jgi:hypothetical protein
MARPRGVAERAAEATARRRKQARPRRREEGGEMVAAGPSWLGKVEDLWTDRFVRRQEEVDGGD